MTPITLRLVPSPSLGEAAAWFIPGGDTQRWLGELLRWPDLPPATPVAVIGHAGSTPIGLLVRTPVRPAQGTIASPLKLVASRVLVPLEARIAPPVTTAELDRLLPPGIVVWLPDGAPWVVPLDQQRQVGELVGAPSLFADRWLTPPPILPPARLVEIRPADVVDLEPLFNAEATGIGKNPMNDLPARSGEPSALNVFGRQVAGRIGRAIGGMMSGLGASELGDGLQRMFEKLGGHLDPRVLERRFAALHRLMDLLDKDPDAGLQRALPLGGDDQQQPRGLAAPGWQLGWRMLDFSLRSRGSGPVDPWIVPDELRLQLRQRYLRLAEQAAERGDFRRAAAIHAQLLSDWAAAAQVLERGHHYREAAAIYRERLKQPGEAARCFARGGLLVEAAHAHTELGQHVEAGHCWRRHGDEDRAREAYGRAEQHCRERDDVVGAAAIRVEHLHDTEGAIALLVSTWPEHPQASAALKMRVHLHTNAGHTTALTSLLVELRSLPRQYLPAAIPSLHTLGFDHPDMALREEAEDVLRCLVGDACATQPDAGLIGAFAAFTSRDRQVNEDAGRWLREAQREARKRPLVQERGFTLVGFPVKVENAVHLLIALSDGVLLFTQVNGKPHAQRVTWEGHVLPPVRLLDDSEVGIDAFKLHGTGERVFAYAQTGGNPDSSALPLVTLPTTDMWKQATKIGTFGPLVPQTIAASPDRFGGWWLVAVQDDALVLVQCPATGQTRRIVLDGLDRGSGNMCVAACAEGCWVSCGNDLRLYSFHESLVAKRTLDHFISHLVQTPAGEVLAISGDKLIHLQVSNKSLIAQRVIADHLPSYGDGSYTIAFTAAGSLVVGLPGELRVYRKPSYDRIFAHAPLGVGVLPVAMISDPQPHHVVVLESTGWLRRVRIELA